MILPARSSMQKSAKKLAKVIVRQTIGRLPPPSSRLTGRLASDGGKRVRDTRLRPWAGYHDGNLIQWFFRMGPAFRKIFISGVEGVTQPLAKQFAHQWAEYCGCRYGLLLPHGTDALRIALAAVLDHDGLDYGGRSSFQIFHLLRVPRRRWIGALAWFL